MFVAVRPATLVALALLGAARPAAADPSNSTPTDDLGNAKADSGAQAIAVPHDQIVIKSTPDRTSKNIALVASIAGAGALVGGLGLYWHLDSRSAANDVSAATFTHQPWTPALQATEDRANRSATRAEIAYSVGGAVLVGAVVLLILTEPREETTILHPHVAAMPTRDGAAIAAAWRF